jgi:hypothetical protein
LLIHHVGQGEAVAGADENDRVGVGFGALSGLFVGEFKEVHGCTSAVGFRGI